MDHDIREFLHGRNVDFMHTEEKRPPSIFVQRLLTFVALGVLSPNQAQRLAEGISISFKLDDIDLDFSCFISCVCVCFDAI